MMAQRNSEDWPLVADELRKAHQCLSDAEWAGRTDGQAAARLRYLLQAQAWGETRIPPF